MKVKTENKTFRVYWNYENKDYTQCIIAELEDKYSKWWLIRIFQQPIKELRPFDGIKIIATAEGMHPSNGTSRTICRKTSLAYALDVARKQYVLFNIKERIFFWFAYYKMTNGKW